MLKAELHIHSREDPEDRISYTAQEMIDYASQQNFEVLALGCHNKVVYDRELERYARERNILLIPGVERTIEGKHVLLYNLTDEEAQQISSFRKLREFKKEKEKRGELFLVVAAHPFHFAPVCLKNKVVEYLDLFDAWEFSYFYTKQINCNKKTVGLAKEYGKPLVGSSDVHRLEMLGKTYSLIKAEKNIEAIFQAIKEGWVKIETKPLGFFEFGKVFLIALVSFLRKSYKNKNKSL